MLKLIETFMANPLQSVVAALSMVVIFTFLGLNQVEVAMAVVEEKQRHTELIMDKVHSMNDTLIRVDENLKILLEK